MFDGVGWSEVLVLLVVAVIIFGPDKLPKVAADLAKGLKMVRNWAQRARSELEDELPPELRNIDIASLNPKTFVRNALLDDDDDPLGLNEENGTKHAAATRSTRKLSPGEPAPFDADAT